MIAELDAQLELFDVSKLSSSELETWYHLRGIAAFRHGDRQLAKARFTEAHDKFPKSAMIAFSLGQECEFTADVATMFELFDRSRIPSVPATHALAQSRYAYLWGDIERALSYVTPILEMHYKLGIADDTFLYMRGMPFFSQTWAYLAAFYELRGELDILETITEQAASRLKDYNFTIQRDFLASMRTGDFSRYTGDPNHGTGYQRTMVATILARGAETLDRANETLDSVRFADNDFPWLVDMVLLAKCEAAHRFDPLLEPALVKSFFARQPLLFEPDHAVTFRMLGYQESLKPIYQSGRKSSSNRAS